MTEEQEQQREYHKLFAALLRDDADFQFEYAVMGADHMFQKYSYLQIREWWICCHVLRKPRPIEYYYG